MTILEHTIEGFDGTRLFYEVEGEGDCDICLCDGIGCDGWIWKYMRPMLLQYGRIVHLHIRGHGRSEAPSNPAAVTLEDIADDWNYVFQAEHTKRAVLLGHSMGVQTELEIFHRHPEHIVAMGLLCGSFEHLVSTFHNGPALKFALPVLQTLAHLAPRPVRAIWQNLVTQPIAFYIARLTEVHTDLTIATDFQEYFDHMAAVDPRIFCDMLAAAGRHSASSFIDDINIPCLVIAGERDNFTPCRLSKDMAARLKNSKMLVVEEGTHATPVEHPTLVNLHVENLLKEIGLVAH